MHATLAWLATLALVAIGTFAHAQGDAKTLKVVPHSNLAILDPIWTTQYMVRNHGYMIYDTLFGTDEKSQIRPQMVERWTVSPDNRLWTFTLRNGLAFHDDQPVTGEDVIASLERWGKRDTMGQKLFSFIQRMDTPDARTFRIFLREACGIMLEALGKPSSNVPFIMPKRVADTPADRQIEDYTGSGPYVFRKDDWKPGNLVVYTKNAKYIARNEPPSGTAGGKRVFVDRVEWHVGIRDPQTQINALIKGEVDIIERPAFESYGQLRKESGIEIVNKNSLGFQYMARFNHPHPPFNDPKIRQAALAAMTQEPFLRTQVGIKEYYKPCASMLTCGTPYGSATGSEIQSKSNLNKSQELLKAAGYDGTPIVIIKPTDLASIGKLPDVAAQQLRQAGFKVDLQSMDWNTLVSRRAKREAPAQGGWNLFLTAWVSPDIWSPLTNAAINSSCDKAWFGWSCDEQIEKLRDQFAREVDPRIRNTWPNRFRRAPSKLAPMRRWVSTSILLRCAKG